jgi:NADPH:quinone reductase-like Zn-dependent oxidoreductase
MMVQRCSHQSRHCTGRGPSHGAFQKFAVVPRIAVAELPYGIATSRGVVLPLGVSTAAVRPRVEQDRAMMSTDMVMQAGLYQKGFLALPFPTEEPEAVDRTVLIWGGSSSVGSCAIQLAVASGLDVVVTASPRNFKYCKGLGAKQCFDYHDKGQ